MGKYANKVVTQAQAWLGINESNGGHKVIIDTYNSYPVARGYKMTLSDPWCATFVSAVSIKLGYTDIIPTECSCTRMIELFKKLGCWVENENRVPNPGDIIFYNWSDNGVGDNKDDSDHVGIVEKIVGNTIVVIEGNYKKSVARREITVNGRYIRGFAVPKYDAEVVVAKKSIAEVAKEVINGKWGNGADRKARLTAAGYNYNEVQAKVNEILKAPKKKSIDEIAREVINGEWGNGQERKDKLKAAGYDYKTVQNKVNELLR